MEGVDVHYLDDRGFGTGVVRRRNVSVSGRRACQGLVMNSTRSLEGAAKRVCDVLDPILTQHRFGGGQVGIGTDSFTVLFCAAYDHFVDRFPDLADADHLVAGARACIDLHVQGTGAGTLKIVDVEGAPLATLLRTANLNDAASAVDSIDDLTLDDALDAISTALSALLASPPA